MLGFGAKMRDGVSPPGGALGSNKKSEREDGVMGEQRGRRAGWGGEGRDSKRGAPRGLGGQGRDKGQRYPEAKKAAGRVPTQ